MPAGADLTRFVLVDVSHRGNVGAAARAIRVMGFHELVLVNPRFADVLSHDETIAMASGATDVLAHARVVGTLTDALGRRHPRLRHRDDAARFRPAHLGAPAPISPHRPCSTSEWPSSSAASASACPTTMCTAARCA